ncbi:MAG: hypothetical protein DCC57_20865 [Chloroflexi bacterium]|nr:MAG: hypothetical protein DCC57_20865 [Chloroflexota bacterium]
MMMRRQALGTAGGAAVSGAALLAFILWSVPPTYPSGEPNPAALLLFLLGLLLLVFGFGGLVALALHGRWPNLAGIRDRRKRPDPGVALRQGGLLAAAVGVMGVLTYLGLLDIAFALVTLVIAGLVEAFLQNRKSR